MNITPIKAHEFYSNSDIYVDFYCYDINIDFRIESENFKYELEYSYENGWEITALEILNGISVDNEESLKEIIIKDAIANVDVDAALAQIDNAISTMSEALNKEE